jgi:hypothetical protein
MKTTNVIINEKMQKGNGHGHRFAIIRFFHSPKLMPAT